MEEKKTAWGGGAGGRGEGAAARKEQQGNEGEKRKRNEIGRNEDGGIRGGIWKETGGELEMKEGGRRHGEEIKQRKRQ